MESFSVFWRHHLEHVAHETVELAKVAEARLDGMWRDAKALASIATERDVTASTDARSAPIGTTARGGPEGRRIPAESGSEAMRPRRAAHHSRLVRDAHPLAAREEQAEPPTLF